MCVCVCVSRVTGLLPLTSSRPHSPGELSHLALHLRTDCCTVCTCVYVCVMCVMDESPPASVIALGSNTCVSGSKVWCVVCCIRSVHIGHCVRVRGLSLGGGWCVETCGGGNHTVSEGQPCVAKSSVVACIVHTLLMERLCSSLPVCIRVCCMCVCVCHVCVCVCRYARDSDEGVKIAAGRAAARLAATQPSTLNSES